MNLLKEKILKEGIVLEERILKVDHFVNQQIDIKILRYIGQAFAKGFKNQGITKILTIEASGIAFAIATAYEMDDLTVVFAKKDMTAFGSDDYHTEVYSFTKQRSYRVAIDKRFIEPGDKILIIDDFLAHGNAVLGLAELVKQAKASVVGVGIVIEKTFQNGKAKVEAAGYPVHSLARICSLKNNQVHFDE